MRPLSLALGVLVAGVACSESGTVALTSYTGTLTSEIIDTAQVTLLLSPDGTTFNATLKMSNGYGFFDESAPLQMQGRADPYPEAGLIAYSATLTMPAVSAGPCGNAPVSLTLSLVRRGGNAHVGGGLAAYCGSATYSGAPQRIMRLAGDLSVQ
jgi:hypothetical protein